MSDAETHPPVNARAFFEQLDEDRYQPTEATIGPWSPKLQHGGPPIALLTHQLRQYPSDNPNLRITRLTAEFLGPVPVQPCTVKVEVVRPGKRIELLRASIEAEGRTAMIAHAWRLEVQPKSTPVVAEAFTLPSMPSAEASMIFPSLKYFPYFHSMEWRYVNDRPNLLGPALLWARPRIPLIEGQKLDPMEALLLMLDSANGVSAELDIREWSFVPVDLSLTMVRPPEGEWVGMDAHTVIADDGVGMSHTIVFDRQGALGRSAHSLFIRRHG